MHSLCMIQRMHRIFETYSVQIDPEQNVVNKFFEIQSLCQAAIIQYPTFRQSIVVTPSTLSDNVVANAYAQAWLTTRERGLTLNRTFFS